MRTNRELPTFTFSLLVTVYACHKEPEARNHHMYLSCPEKQEAAGNESPAASFRKKRTTRLNAGPESIEMAGAAFLAGPDLNELRCNGDGYFLRRLGSDRQTNGSRHPGQFLVADAFLP